MSTDSPKAFAHTVLPIGLKKLGIEELIEKIPLLELVAGKPKLSKILPFRTSWTNESSVAKNKSQECSFN